MDKLLANLVTIDFETKAIESALPPEPVGVSIKMPGQASTYMAWGHREGNNTTKDAATKRLKSIFKNHPVLMHNKAFDLNVAKYWLDIPYPAESHDTLLLLFLRNPHAKTLALKPSAEEILKIPPTARDEVREWILANVPGAKPSTAGKYIWLAPVSLVGPYACSDTDMTHALFCHLYQEYSGKAYERERALTQILCQNTLDGIRLDQNTIYTDFIKYSNVRTNVESMIFKHLGSSFNLDSGDELADAIIKAGTPADWVLTKTGKRSTSKDNLMAAIKDTTLLDLLSYRGTLSTYLDTFFASWINKENDGRIHFSWNQVRNEESRGFLGTRTGRLSSVPSMLNVPKKPPEVNPIYKLPDLPFMRKYLMPDEGQFWLSRDYSSQELRILAHYEDGAMMRAYNENPQLDLHQMMSEILTEALGHFVSRRVAKTIAFSILYGTGLAAMAEGLGCSIDEAAIVKRAYLSHLSGIASVQQSIKAAWDIGDPIKTWGDRFYYKEESREITDKRTGQKRWADFTYKGLNYLIQSSSADVTKQAILNYNSIKKDGRFLVSVHDQIDISAPLSEMKLLREAMLDIKLDVPMVSEGSYGTNMVTEFDYEEAT